MADADREQEIQALKAQVMFLSGEMKRHQAQVREYADQRREVIRRLAEDHGVPLAEIARMADISYQAVQQALKP